MTVVKTGPEQTVNTTTKDDQSEYKVVALADGGYIVHWLNREFPIDGVRDIRAQRFDAAGNKVGGEFVLSPEPLTEFTVVALADRGFVTIWTQEALQPGALFPAQAIYGQRYDATGATVGGEFLIAAPIFDAEDLSAAATDDGGFVVTWNNFPPNGNGSDQDWEAISGQRVDAFGNRVGAAFQVNTEPEGPQVDSSVAGLDGGGFVVAWADEPDPFDPDPNAPTSIRAQRFNAAGEKIGPEILVVADGDGERPNIVALDGGGFVVEWGGSARVYGASGAEIAFVDLGDAADVTGVRIASVEGGGFLVTRTAYDEATLTRDIFVQLYSSTGDRVGGELRVNDFVYRDQTIPEVATLTDGRIAITWSGPEIHTVILDPLGRGIDRTDASETINGSPVGSATANDVIYAYGGDDVVNALDGDDYVLGGRGNDTISGGDGVDVLNGGAGNDILRGDAGNDTLIGEAGDDRLEGGAGDDILRGGAGADAFFGGDGFDIVSYEQANAGFVLATNYAYLSGIRGSGGDADYDTFDSIEGLVGSEFSYDVFRGNEVDNLLVGDDMSGLAGDDRLVGSERVTRNLADYRWDVNYGGNGGVTVNLMTGTATDGFGDHDTLTSIEWVYGTNFNDDITGNDAANVLDGSGGADRILGHGGNDEISVGGGDDFVDAGAGNDLIQVSGAAGVLYGGDGDDRFRLGGVGAGELHGGRGNDVYEYATAQDANIEDADGGIDLVITGATSYTLATNVENLRVLGGNVYSGAGSNITGNALGNSIWATLGNDTITGLAGDDVIEGSQGHDTIDGGQGNDTAVYKSSATVDLAISGPQNTGYLGNDTLISIENLTGGGGADTFYGTSGVNRLAGGDGNDALYGRGGDDILQGGLGDDILDGGDGYDTASYLFATAPVYIDLSYSGRQHVPGEGADILINIENIVGSAFGGTLIGDDGDNTITGGEGDDDIRGGAGDDRLEGGGGHNTFDGGLGDDVMIATR